MRIRSIKPEFWRSDDYPTDWQTPGAPIRTWRTPPGTRHSPGYSPFGGYDVAVIESENQ